MPSCHSTVTEALETRLAAAALTHQPVADAPTHQAVADAPTVAGARPKQQRPLETQGKFRVHIYFSDMHSSCQYYKADAKRV
jgi:DUF971 family protein